MVAWIKKSCLLMVGLMMVLLVGCKKDDVITIGISQFVAHPALDRAREGFIDALRERGYVEGENIKFDVQNAAADFTQTDLIARNFVSKKVNLIFAIATPSAQSAKNASEKSQIPVLFSAVTDAEIAGLVKSNEKPGGNVSGTSDMSPMDKQLALITQLLGEGKTIGVLYNTGEVNSVVQVEVIEKEAKVFNHTIEAKGVTTTQELRDALTILMKDVDAFLIPTDNLMATAIELIVEEAKEKGIPVFGTEAAHVEGGALLTEGIDYYDLGFQTGLMAADILENKKSIENIPVELIKETQLIINLETARDLNITIPEELLERAETIGTVE